MVRIPPTGILVKVVDAKFFIVTPPPALLLNIVEIPNGSVVASGNVNVCVVPPVIRIYSFIDVAVKFVVVPAEITVNVSPTNCLA